MDLENALQPRCIVIDRNRYKVYIEHFEAGKETRKHIAARIQGRSRFRTVFIDTKSTFHPASEESQG